MKIKLFNRKRIETAFNEYMDTWLLIIVMYEEVKQYD